MTSDASAPGGGTRPGTVSPAVAALQTSLAAVADATNGLREDVRNAEKARTRTTRISFVLIAVLAVLLGLVLVVSWQLKETNDHIADCTTAGGQCYEESRRRTGGAISAVTQISVFVSQCARQWPNEVGPEYDRKLEQCVAERLAARAAASGQPG